MNPDPQIKISDSQDNTQIEEDSKLRYYLWRERKAPQYLNGYLTNSEEDSDQALINIDYCYKVTCNVPLSYKEALNSSKAHCWNEAMHEEMESLKENDVFELTPPPEVKKTVGSKWVYMIKKNPGGPERYKARFFTREFSQTKGVRPLRNLFPYYKYHLSTHLNANGCTIWSDCPSDGCNHGLFTSTSWLWNFLLNSLKDLKQKQR